MNLKKFSLIIVTALVLLNAVACGQQSTPVVEQSTPVVEQPTQAVQTAASTQVATAAPDVHIGSVWPITGADAALGTVSDHGADLAVKEINDAGGIKSLGGAKLVLEKGDAQSDPAVTTTEVERIASMGNISAFIGVQASALTLAATEVTERDKIPWVTYSVADKLVQRGFKYIFLISPLTSYYGKAPVDFVDVEYKKLNLPTPKVAILYEDSAYGTGVSAFIRAEAKLIGQNIVLDESYPAGETDASPQVLKVKQSGAQILYLASYLTDAVLLQRTLNEQGVDITVIGCGVGHTMNEFAQTLGKGSDYVYVAESSDASAKIPGQEALATEYEATYGGTTLPLQAVGGYTLVYVVKAALEAAGSADPEAVRNALAGLDLTTGPASWTMSRRLKFNADGSNMYGVMGIFMWKGGNLGLVYPPDLATSPLVFPPPPLSTR